MALGKRPQSRQQELWIAADRIAGTPRHVFYEALNRLLAKAQFDAWVEQLCAEHYADVGRPSIPPGVYFRMLLIGYFEGLDSQRGIAWRCADSLSLKAFLGCGSTEATPEHSSLTKIRQRLSLEAHRDVFRFVLRMVEEQKLLSGKTAGVDSTTLEANAAMKSIVRKESGEDWNEYVTRLMREEGAIGPEETPTAEEIRRFDKRRQNKKVSNEEWKSSTDCDARISKMKDGRTHLAYKAEHVIDLQTEAVMAAEIYHADEADTATLRDSLETAQGHVDATESERQIEKVAADKGYHAAETLADCEELGVLGVKTYIPEPELPHRRKWSDKPREHRRAVYANRRRVQSDYGKKLQRRRSEVVERSFAHVCDTGGSRRSWLRGLLNVRKRYLLAATAHNLGLILRKLLKRGKPRAFADLWLLLRLAQIALFKSGMELITLLMSRTNEMRCWTRYVVTLLTFSKNGHCSTGC